MRIPGVVVAVVAMLAVPASAGAAVGDIAQLSGTAGCIEEMNASADNCTASIPTTLTGVYQVAISPDGKDVYAAGYLKTASLDTFARNGDGSLTEAQCFQETGYASPSCTTVPVGVLQDAFGDGPYWVLVSSDGKSVYTVGPGGIGEFSRDTTTGMLTYAGCVADGGGASGTCTNVSGTKNDYAAAISPDGKSLYVGQPSGQIVVLSRDAGTGLLSDQSCFNTTGSSGCTALAELTGAYSLTVSPDNKNVYEGDSNEAILEFTRNTSTGGLTYSGCIANSTSGCAKGHNLGFFPRELAVSPDGTSLYDADDGSGTLVVFSRDTSTGALSEASGSGGCFGSGGCAAATGLGSPWGVTVSPDGHSVYVGGDGISGNLVDFDRSSSGALIQSSTTPCVGQSSCAAGRAMSGGVRGVVVSPDGANVYVGSYNAQSLLAFSRSGSASYSLNVTLAGAGSGTVIGSGISCPGTCSSSYSQGAVVTLTAAPSASSTFAGWSGACSGTGTCQVTMGQDQAVTATFAANTPSPPACTLTSRGKVAVRHHFKHAKKHGSPANGSLAVKVSCDQATAVSLSGKLTAMKRGKHGHKSHIKHFTLKAKANVQAGVTTTIKLKLPASAFSDLRHGAKESIIITLVAKNANGTGRATLTVSLTT